MTTDQTPDRLDGLRTEYANTGMVKYDGAVWLISQVVVLRERVQQLSAVPVPPPADQTALRDRVRRALCEAAGFGFAWGTDMLEPDEYGEVADVVLAVLPEQTNRATVRGVKAEALLLRFAAEEQPGAGCWCSHPRDRHWAGSTRMTFPDGCHDCRGWNGAHVYGQELPWADDKPDAERPAVGEQPETQEARHLGGRANAEDCPACKGTNPPYPFLCPGPDAP